MAPGRPGGVYARHPDWPDWLIDAEVTVGTYGPRIVSLKVTPFTLDSDGDVRPSDDPANAPEGGIPRRLLGSISTPQLVAMAQENAGYHPGYIVAGFEVPADVKTLASATPKRRPARNERSEAFYATLAKEYHDLVVAGVTKPAKVIAERRHLSYGTVRNLLVEVRRPSRKMLTKPGRGLTGGQLTPRALEVLARINSENDAAN